MPALNDLQGLWRRAYIVWPNGGRDDTTDVAWVQGPTLFGDLRVPAGRPDFAHVLRLRDLRFDDIRWLAGQEGFGGRLSFDGRYFEWRRIVDYQPPSGDADAGSLREDGDGMIEIGRDVPYEERWVRPVGAPQRMGALALLDRADGRPGFLVWAGEDFAYVRDRATSAPHGRKLFDLVAEAGSLEEAQDLVDCEISIGRIEPAGWRIVRSSLPFREGQTLAPTLDLESRSATTRDLAPDGAPSLRDWIIEDWEGGAAEFSAQEDARDAEQ